MAVAIREIQIPLLALVLLGACAAKLARTVRTRSVNAGLGPTELFPRRLRRLAAIAICCTELALAPALILTAGRFGSHERGDAVRLATAVLFLIALCGLVELREHRPDLGCGCFGDLSVKPVGIRSIARAGLLAVAALVTIGLPPLHLPPPGARAATGLGIMVGELLLLALLSPEAGEALMRLGYTEPCELREFTAKRALTALHRSRLWRKQSALVTGEPADMWRELCWWYLVYPASGQAPGTSLVFAVQVKQHRPAIRSALAGPEPPSWPGQPVPDAGEVAPVMRSAAF